MYENLTVFNLRHPRQVLERAPFLPACCCRSAILSPSPALARDCPLPGRWLKDQGGTIKMTSTFGKGSAVSLSFHGDASA